MKRDAKIAELQVLLYKIIQYIIIQKSVLRRLQVMLNMPKFAYFLYCNGENVVVQIPTSFIGKTFMIRHHPQKTFPVFSIIAF